MYIVALTRRGPGFDEQLPQLAERLGVFVHDLRMRVTGPLPVVVTRVAAAADATALMHELRGLGHGAVGCDADKIPTLSSMHQPREFAFDGDVLRTEGSGHTRAEVHASDVYALLHAMAVDDHQTTRERKSKAFSASRAVLSGGLVNTRTVKSTERMTETTSEERIYLIRRGFTDPMVFCQHHLRYTGLGAEIGRSSLDSFARLAQRLRSFCPEAIHDDRLRSSRRKGADASVDLAVHLLLVGYARGQL